MNAGERTEERLSKDLVVVEEPKVRIIANCNNIARRIGRLPQHVSYGLGLPYRIVISQSQLPTFGSCFSDGARKKPASQSFDWFDRLQIARSGFDMENPECAPRWYLFERYSLLRGGINRYASKLLGTACSWTEKCIRSPLPACFPRSRIKRSIVRPYGFVARAQGRRSRAPPCSRQRERPEALHRGRADPWPPIPRDCRRNRPSAVACR